MNHYIITTPDGKKYRGKVYHWDSKNSKGVTDWLSPVAYPYQIEALSMARDWADSHGIKYEAYSLMSLLD